ncbi:MAG: hypothetical protein PHO26_07340 [Dehalococcoidia bacterium]|nr:hypothetical protein [Dehalococcoidia bacterium]MDD5493915.1 hypothetical protein [Dehalococcoidia bacterium]
MNWFKRHLNWTLLIATILLPLLTLLIAYFVNDSLGSTSPKIIGWTSTVLILVIYGWVLQQKKRSLWWLLLFWWPIGCFIYMGLSNKKEPPNLKESAEQLVVAEQERQRAKFKEATGADLRDIVPEIGLEISWADIVNQVFRVLEFDRSDTTIEQNNQVQAGSSFKPYGYLLVESPILNQKVRLPIIHRDDFLLAASVFDVPTLATIIVDEELLVTYAPKHLRAKGLSGSPHHVLHYLITRRGTLDSYYSMNNNKYMAKPEPQKLFGQFVYEGEIRVQINSEPKL